MIQEAMELFKETVEAAGRVQIVPLPGRGDKVLVVRPGEAVLEVKTDTPPRHDRLHSLKSFADAAKAFGSEVVVYVGKEEVEAILNNTGDRLDCLTMPLPLHPQFKLLAGLTGQGWNVKQVVRFLKVSLRGCLQEGFAERFSKLDFDQRTSGGDATGHGRDSLGRKVEMVVSNAEDIPEFFSVSLPVFNLEIATVVSVEVAVTLDTQARTIALEVIPGGIDKAHSLGRVIVMEYLDAALPAALVLDGTAQVLEAVSSE